MITLPTDLLGADIRERAATHAARHGAALRDFRLRVEAQFQQEVARTRQAFSADATRAGAAAFVQQLGSYVGWLGWSSWCASQLAMPLGLTGDTDARRLAAAMLVYAGPRVMDDALDNHHTYKGKRTTLVGALANSHPQLDDAQRRAYAMLAGMWIMLAGIERLRRHAGEAAALTTLRICERIAPGVLLEGMGSGQANLAEYQRILQMKSIWYDEILYRNLLDPCPAPLRTTVLRATAHLSRLAQYLNDIGDYEADLSAGQPNLCTWLSTSEDILDICAQEVSAIQSLMDELPEEVGDALAASLNDTHRAAQRLNETQP
jgi:hypothetical protein